MLIDNGWKWFQIKHNEDLQTCLLFQERSQQSWAKAFKLGSDEKVLTSWWTVAGTLPSSVLGIQALRLVKPNTYVEQTITCQRFNFNEQFISIKSNQSQTLCMARESNDWHPMGSST